MCIRKDLPALLASCSILLPAYSQNNPPQSVTEPVTELSPFVINESRDVGYLAGNTLSSGRFNVSLRDTAASVSVFTQEFMADIGAQGLDDLLNYSVSTVPDTGDTIAGENIIDFRNSERTVSRMLIRGIQVTQGRNFFQAITPDDGYLSSRYDESRGPNGILFGISNAGGMISSSSWQANLNRNELKLKYTTGSWSKNRSEFQSNTVVAKSKLGIALAGLYENSAGYRAWTADDRKRLYSAVKFQPTNRITIQVMGETGKTFTRQVTPFTFGDNFLAWDDNGRPLVQPNGSTAGGITRSQGVGGQVSNNFSGGNRGREGRHVFIENSDIRGLYNLGGTFATSSYNDPNVIGGIAQKPGVFGSVGTLRINDPKRFPYDTNFEGTDGTGRDSRFGWWQIDATVRILKNLYFTAAHNRQLIRMKNPYLAGSDPEVDGDPNLTLGVVPANLADPFTIGPSNPALVAANRNPYAGRLYVEADQRYDERVAKSEESRLSFSYDFDTRSRWLGHHRMAVAVSRRTAMDLIENHRLAFLGAPFNSSPVDNDNLIWNRYYFKEGNLGDYAYRQTLLPYNRNATTTITVHDLANPSFYRDGINNGGVQREVGWVRGNDRDNQRTDQQSDAYLAVTQSNFLQDRLVVTLGYREDRAESFDYAFFPLNKFGYTVNQGAPNPRQKFTGRSKTAGGVFHLTNNLSLVSNWTESVGLPDFIRRVLPENYLENALNVVVPPAPDTGGRDYGIAFSLVNGKIAGRAVYYETYAKNQVTGGIAGNVIAAPTKSIFGILENTLLGTRYSQREWETLRARLTTDVTGALEDTQSKGYEFSLVGNPTKNWRLTLNFSYTDRTTANSYKRDIPWLGYIRGPNTKTLLTPFDYNGSVYTVPATPRITQDGVIAQFISLAQQAAAIQGVSTTAYLNLGGSGSIADLIQGPNNRQLFRLNDRIQQEEQRWGLRPYKANFFSAYDFKGGALKGFSLGGGVRWQSKNVIGGANRSQVDPTFYPSTDKDVALEFKGVDIFQTDLMLRYRLKPKDKWGPVTFQLNVYNVLDEHDIIPQRLATSPTQLFPGGDRGTAYTRFDIVQPRNFRFSVSYEF